MQRKHQDPDHERATDGIDNNFIEFPCRSGSPLAQHAEDTLANGKSEKKRDSDDTQGHQESVPMLFDKRNTGIHPNFLQCRERAGSAMPFKLSQPLDLSARRAEFLFDFLVAAPALNPASVVEMVYKPHAERLILSTFRLTY